MQINFAGFSAEFAEQLRTILSGIKIAINGNDHWQEVAAKVGAWFVTGEVKYFDNDERALAWLNL